MLTLGDFRLDLISDGMFEDDADTFVQSCVERHPAPRVKVKGKARIKVGFNSLLVRGGGRTIVIDPGTGDKPRSRLREQYRLEWPRKFLPALTELGVGRERVDTAILTHLHWDHCGAATSASGHGLVPTFPNARYYAQRAELESARERSAAGDDGYNPDDYEPLVNAGVLNLLDGDFAIVPGISVQRVGGHSAGLQVVTIGSDSRAIYLSDLVPTATQLPPDCVLSYDMNIEELKAAKIRILDEAVRRHDLLLFVHAPRALAGYVEREANGSLRLIPLQI
jgi:glyoxylase-like metal-dependent hydrolase (beta-lactamase superfamily II)